MTAVIAPSIAAVGHGSTAYWYFTRSTGLVALILLTATVTLGIASSVGWSTERWPRFLSQGLHRNLSLYCLVVVAVHIVTTVADGYVPITLADAVIPFVSPYRPLWVGLGALALDLMLAVAVTSALRRHIGLGAWRAVHWLAYLCWPIALLHGLGSGSDTRLPAGLAVYAGCVLAVAGALAWRLVVVRSPRAGWRVVTACAAIAVVVISAIFTAEGPLRPGWSRRSGTSAAVLAQIAAATSPATSSSSPEPSSSAAPTTTVPGTSLPSVPFSTAAMGTIGSEQLSTGQLEVTVRLTLHNSSVPLVVQLVGDPVRGGVAMKRSKVAFGPDQGTVSSLEGTSIVATVTGTGGPLDLAIQLSIDQSAGTVTGTVSGSTGQ